MKRPRQTILGPFGDKKPTPEEKGSSKRKRKEPIKKTTLENYKTQSTQVLLQTRNELETIYHNRNERGIANHVLDLQVAHELLNQTNDRSELTQLLKKYKTLQEIQDLDQTLLGRIPQDERLLGEYQELEKRIQEIRRIKTQELITEENRMRRDFFYNHVETIDQQVKERGQTFFSDTFPLTTQVENQIFPSTQRISTDMILDILQANERIERDLNLLKTQFQHFGDLRDRESRFQFTGEGPYVQIGTSMRNDPIFQTLMGTFMVTNKGYAYVYDVIHETFLYPNSKNYFVRQTDQDQFFLTRQDYPVLFEDLNESIQFIFYDSDTGTPFLVQQDKRVNLDPEKYGVLRPLFLT